MMFSVYPCNALIYLNAKECHHPSCASANSGSRGCRAKAQVSAHVCSWPWCFSWGDFFLARGRTPVDHGEMRFPFFGGKSLMLCCHVPTYVSIGFQLPIRLSYHGVPTREAVEDLTNLFTKAHDI